METSQECCNTKEGSFFPPFFVSFFFFFYQSGSSICRWLNIFWELHRATFSGMCHIVLTSLLYVTLISADIHTMTLQGQSIRNIHVHIHFNNSTLTILVYMYIYIWDKISNKWRPKTFLHWILNFCTLWHYEFKWPDNFQNETTTLTSLDEGTCFHWSHWVLSISFILSS